MRVIDLLGGVVLAAASASALAAPADGFDVGGGEDFKRRMLSWQGESAPAALKAREVVGANGGVNTVADNRRLVVFDPTKLVG